MKTILLIGLGRFGRHAAMKLDELHHEVMAVDKDEERVRAVLPYVTNAQIGDGTQEEFLSSLGVNNFDVCIVAIGDDFQSGNDFITERIRRKDGCCTSSKRCPCKIFVEKWCG